MGDHHDQVWWNACRNHVDFDYIASGYSRRIHCSPGARGDNVLVQYFDNENCDGKPSEETIAYGCRQHQGRDPEWTKYIKYKCHTYRGGDQDLRSTKEEEKNMINSQMDITLLAMVP